MTEKSYGGNVGFGMKEKNIKESGASKELKVKKEKKSEMNEEYADFNLSREEIENYIKAGQIGKEVRKFTKGFIKPKMKLIEIAEKIENKIKELGGECAFPTNLSLNEIAAHYTPNLNDETIAEGLLKIDIGISFKGAIADFAFSLDLTEDGKYGEMIKLNEKILEAELSVIKSGVTIGEIGEQVSELLENTGFSVIKNLSGHSLGEDVIHAGLTIPNYPNTNTTELKNIAIAIEPFLTTGQGMVYDGKPSEIYMLQAEGQTRDNDARKLLEFVKENYKTRPFCKRWLEKAGLKKVSFSLLMLTRQGILHNFPVLVEKSKLPVSQAEHTALILKDKVIITTKN